MDFETLRKYFNDKLDNLEGKSKQILDEYTEYLYSQKVFDSDFELQNHLLLASAKLESNFGEVRGINKYFVDRASSIIWQFGIYPFMEEQSRTLRIITTIENNSFKIESLYLNEIDSNNI